MGIWFYVWLGFNIGLGVHTLKNYITITSAIVRGRKYTYGPLADIMDRVVLSSIIAQALVFFYIINPA